MADYIKIKATYRDAITFDFYDADGDALDLTPYTFYPFLYTFPSRQTAGTAPSIYLSGSDAGTTVKESTTGRLTWHPLNTTFPSASQDYNLRFQMSSGSFETEYPVQGDDIKVIIY